MNHGISATARFSELEAKITSLQLEGTRQVEELRTLRRELKDAKANVEFFESTRTIGEERVTMALGFNRQRPTWVTDYTELKNILKILNGTAIFSNGVLAELQVQTPRAG